MNPIVHGEIGWFCGARLERWRDRLMVTVAGVFPDIDGVGILVSEEMYAAFHHKLTHGIFGALFVAVVVGALSRRWQVAAWAVLAYHLHIVCDLVGSGPGWPLWYFWPLHDVEWLPSWQWGLASWQNSVIGLAVTLTCLAGALWWRRTPVELFSRRGDEAVVQTVRQRFGRDDGRSDEVV